VPKTAVVSVQTLTDFMSYKLDIKEFKSLVEAPRWCQLVALLVQFALTFSHLNIFQQVGHSTLWVLHPLWKTALQSGPCISPPDGAYIIC
jgi:hypothetical protein